MCLHFATDLGDQALFADVCNCGDRLRSDVLESTARPRVNVMHELSISQEKKEEVLVESSTNSRRRQQETGSDRRWRWFG